MSAVIIAAVAIAAVLVAVIVIVPLVVPVPPLRSTVPPSQLADHDSHFASIDGITVHYKVYGAETESRAILLLHGFGASTFSWRDVGPLLGREYRVVAIDRTGYGLTRRPLPPNRSAWRSASPYSYEAQAEAAFGLLDELGVREAAVVGHSQGAAVAVAMAVISPERVSALVLTAPGVNNGVIPSWILPALRTRQGRALGRLIARSLAQRGTASILRRAFADPATATPEVVEGYRKPLRADDWDVGLWEMTIAPQPIRPKDDLDKLEGIPTLVITPTADRIVSPKAERETQAAIPGAKLTEASGQNHLFHEDHPAEFVKLAEGFLDSARPG
jgi:pimeloyl-ACP methyl ester carboxylesterase